MVSRGGLGFGTIALRRNFYDDHAWTRFFLARTSVTGRSSTATASARALLGLWLLERSLTWVYSPFALIPTTPSSSLSIHWARSSSLLLMQRAHGLLIGSPAMPPITPTAPTLMTPHTSCAAWRRFWQGRSWNFLILGLSFPFHEALKFVQQAAVGRATRTRSTAFTARSSRGPSEGVSPPAAFA